LKWAETSDGFIAGENFEQIKISNALSHKLSHKWRSEEDAIMVGTNTALHDKPRLNVREWTGRNPVRIVIDRNKRLPKNLHLFDDSVKTLKLSDPFEWEVYQKEKIQSILVEGGTKLLQNFIEANFFDEIRVFRSQKQLKKGILSPVLPKNITIMSRQNLFGDELTIYQSDK
jgi:diaminohydroxyphosphoribosylaminopyrimidine deaminase/5-amino-6-(5-phosphoribosylamino)uracil reductase